MRGIWLKRLVGTLILAGAAAGIGWFAWPRLIPVDLAPATLGPMEVTVDDDARTRVRHIYTVSAPIAGKVLRISIRPGVTRPPFTSAIRSPRPRRSWR